MCDVLISFHSLHI